MNAALALAMILNSAQPTISTPHVLALQYPISQYVVRWLLRSDRDYFRITQENFIEFATAKHCKTIEITVTVQPVRTIDFTCTI